MEQQRRMILFFVLSFSAMYMWINIGLPFFHPGFGNKPADQQVEIEPGDETQLTKGDKADDPKKDSGDQPQASQTYSENKTETPQTAKAELELPNYPHRKITLGKAGEGSENFVNVELNSRGAAVEALWLTDKRYPSIGDRSKPLQLLGEENSRLSFDMRVELVDLALDQLQPGLNLEQVNWEVVETSLSATQVTFRYPSPDGRLELLKTYQIFEGDPKRRDSDTNGYSLDVSLQFRNLSDRDIELDYHLQGPVGLPLENVENTRRYMAIQVGVL